MIGWIYVCKFVSSLPEYLVMNKLFASLRISALAAALTLVPALFVSAQDDVFASEDDGVEAVADAENETEEQDAASEEVSGADTQLDEETAELSDTEAEESEFDVFADDEDEESAGEDAPPVPLFGGEEEPSAPADPYSVEESMFQNAVLEGIQLSSEKGTAPDEMIVSCFFIFRDKPSSYFYETKPRDKKIVFEFNDTEKGASPVPSAKEPPIEGFRIEETKIDINKDVQGLRPEWHDVLRVTMFLDPGVPEISVKDEYSIISFSFKWTTDPDKVDQYVIKSRNRSLLLWSLGGLVAAGGVGGYFLYDMLNPEGETGPDEESGPLATDDLPDHGQPK